MSRGTRLARDNCAAAPTGSVEHSCPGTSGTWNNYAIITDGSTIVSNEVYCGAPDVDVPTTQAEFDTNVAHVSATVKSNSDFKRKSDCASGTHTDTSTSRITLHVWKKI